MRFVQLRHATEGRAVALVEGDTLALARDYSTAYDLIQGLRREQIHIRSRLKYDDVYLGHSEWRILPAFDHPAEPARCLVSGTGLTHISSAATRQAMHGAEQQETDSMRMYRWGVEGGHPQGDAIGTAPEWFYKGDGSILRGHGDALTVPWFAEDGGEEAEIAGVYVIDPDGVPVRVGMAIGNEFSDHKFERRNYLYLAHSKLRECAIGPELVLDGEFGLVRGEVKLERNRSVIWFREIASGAERMCHSLANIEHHHFKYPQHRRPGDVHIHFFGADSFSFGAGIALQDGDLVEIAFEGFGRPLRNRVAVESRTAERVTVRAFGV